MGGRGADGRGAGGRGADGSGASGPLVRLEGIEKTFPGVDGGPGSRVLSGVDLDIEAGKSLAILGPSGSGKSTLLFILGTLEAPDAGKVLWGGRDLTQANAQELAAFRSRELGFIFQSHHLLPQCTALENVLVPTLVPGLEVDRAAALDRARALLARVGLGHRLDHRPAQLSGGERQRVAVVRALVNRPKLVLADEPTGSLDPKSAEALGDLLVELEASEDMALVVVTHSERLGHRLGRVFELTDGRLEQTAPAG